MVRFLRSCLCEHFHHKLCLLDISHGHWLIIAGKISYHSNKVSNSKSITYQPFILIFHQSIDQITQKKVLFFSFAIMSGFQKKKNWKGKISTKLNCFCHRLKRLFKRIFDNFECYRYEAVFLRWGSKKLIDFWLMLSDIHTNKERLMKMMMTE